MSQEKITGRDATNSLYKLPVFSIIPSPRWKKLASLMYIYVWAFSIWLDFSNLSLNSFILPVEIVQTNCSSSTNTAQLLR